MHGDHTLRVAGVLLVSVVLACGGGTAGAPDAGSGSVPEGQIVLTVNHARWAKTSSGGTVEVDVTLANGGGSPSAPLNPIQFSLKTTTGLYVSGGLDPAKWLSGDACDPMLSVGAGASATCVLVGELKTGLVPAGLRYQTAGAIAGLGNDRRTEEVAFTPEACTTCGDVCTYLDVDTANCGKCGNAAIAFQYEGTTDHPAICAGGVSACGPIVHRDGGSTGPGSACGAVCADLQNGTYWCGSCKVELSQDRNAATCKSGSLSCPQSEHLCGLDCFDLSTDLKNCGACGVAVATGGTCTAGVPACPYGQTVCSGKCVDLQTDLINCGSCGTAVPAGDACNNGAPGPCTGRFGSCNGVCTDLQSKDHCGSCDTSCGAQGVCESFDQVGPYCSFVLQLKTYVAGVTCEAVCESYSQGADQELGAANDYVLFGGNCKVTADFDFMPFPATGQAGPCAGQAFTSASCFCRGDRPNLCATNHGGCAPLATCLDYWDPSWNAAHMCNCPSPYTGTGTTCH